MQTVLIKRMFTGPQGTFGLVFINRQFYCYSLELPWRDNQRNISCIPADSYFCSWHRSPRFGWTYIVNNVPRRSNILFHSGNVAGDVNKGYKTHSNGCVLLGKTIGKLIGQSAVLVSKPTINNFFKVLAKESFKLEVTWNSWNI